jgi:hypothetical protein
MSYTMKIFKTTGNVTRCFKSGRPHLTTDKDDNVGNMDQVMCTTIFEDVMQPHAKKKWVGA